jgi:AraC-like DNA-binding protein
MILSPDTLDGFARAPVGRYFAGATFAHFCATPVLWGVVLWGRPQSDDMAALVRSLELELADTAEMHLSIVDARRLDGVDVTAFSMLDSYVRGNQDALSRKVARLALLRPDGMTGAVVAGFFDVLPRPYPVELFASPEEAAPWLELELDALNVLGSVYAAASGAPPVVTAIRTVLDQQLTNINIATAARAMGMSERTLQRRLRGADTSFLDELNRARIRAAQKLLLDSDEPVTTIALEVGCATPQHFSTLFRKLTGMTPSGWRKEQRKQRS